MSEHNTCPHCGHYTCDRCSGRATVAQTCFRGTSEDRNGPVVTLRCSLHLEPGWEVRDLDSYVASLEP